MDVLRGGLVCLIPWWWLWWWWWWCSLAGGGVLGMSCGVWSCSNEVRTSTIDGLFFGSMCRHCNTTAATAWASFLEYWPPNLVSMILNTRLLSLKNGSAHSTRVCSASPPLSSSSARLPDSSSNKTTPKLYTSLFGVKWPASFQPIHQEETITHQVKGNFEKTKLKKPMLSYIN